MFGAKFDASMRAMPKSVTLISFARDQQIAGLDVAMDHTLLVRVGKRFQKLPDDVADAPDLALETFAQIRGSGLPATYSIAM